MWARPSHVVLRAQEAATALRGTPGRLGFQGLGLKVLGFRV